MIKVQEHFEACAEDADIRVSSYSGRGMYGAECLSISGSPEACTAVIAHVINSVYDEVIEAVENSHLGEVLHCEARRVVEMLINYSQDSLGHGVVYYWPETEYEGAEVEEDEEYEEDE